MHVCVFMKNIQVANTQTMKPIEMCSFHRNYAACFYNSKTMRFL